MCNSMHIMSKQHWWKALRLWGQVSRAKTKAGTVLFTRESSEQSRSSS